MKSLIIFYFYQELAEQCVFVKMAKIDLKNCRTTDNCGLSREYYFLQTLLIALGNISKILWPTNKRNEERGLALRTVLNVKEDSALKNRDLRNLFEHFDERMDAWFQAADRHGFSDRNVGSMKGGLRAFNPKAWTLTCLGEEYKLWPAIQAVNELYKAIQNEIGQPGKKVMPLRGELDVDL